MGDAMGNVTAIEKLYSLFEKQPCWMIEPLAAAMAYSITSVRRFLAASGYYSCFTDNGVWYTLRSIPRFDNDGLWFFTDIGFSRAGSLINTLVVLITKSPKGMTAEELGEKLHCRCHYVLVDLVRKGRLRRWKLERSYIYTAADPNIAAVQQKVTASSVTQLPAEIAVLILVEFVNNPASSFVQLAKVISESKKITVSSAQIEALFYRLGVKKIPQT
jgi:hypothetical protein